MNGYSEAQLEQDVLEVLAELAWQPLEGKQIGPGSGERESWDELIIPGRLREAITRINPALPAASVDEVVDLVLSPQSQDVKAENRRIHEFLTRGIRAISYVDEYGAEQNRTVHLIDRADPYGNDFLAVRQSDDRRRRRAAPLRHSPLRQWPATRDL